MLYYILHKYNAPSTITRGAVGNSMYHDLVGGSHQPWAVCIYASIKHTVHISI